MRSTFSIIFYLKRQVVKKDGTSPIMGRITVDGTQTQFSCKLTINPKTWDAKQGRVTGRSSAAIETNRMLDKIRGKIQNHYQEIMDRDNYVTAEKMKNAFLGLEYRRQSLLKVYDQFLEDFEKLYNAGLRARATFQKYKVVYKHLTKFISYRYNLSDIALKEIPSTFITDFGIFLRVECGCSVNTVWIYTIPLRTMITTAVNNGWIARDPFYDYEVVKEDTERGFLTMDEIQLLINGKLKNKCHELIRDLFLFCTFTGLSFTDMHNLTESDLRTYFDDNIWIYIRRQKTGVESNIRLLDIPKYIIEKYKNIPKNGKLLPVPTYNRCRSNLTKVLQSCGITKHLTWHCSRHSAATTVLLSNGVPIETVSSILGHKNIATTQHYAKITKEKLNQDMNKLSVQIADIPEYSISAL